MPVVPTATVPSVSPTESAGIGYQSSAAATPEAFGAGIGQAKLGLARQLESTGDMLATHALRMQEDANVTSSEKLFLDQDIKLSKLTDDYNSLQGSARVNALPQFHEDAAALREEGLQNAQNPDVKKKFDQLFTRQLGFSIKAAGRESASAFRADQKATSSSITANSMSTIAKNADDDQQFLSATQTALTSQRALPDYQGASEETKLEMDRTIVSGAWTTRLQSMARNDPLRARDLFNKNKDSLDGISQLKLQDTINQQIINVQSRVDSDHIIQSGALVDTSLAERLKKLEGYSEKPYADFKQTSSGYGTKAQPGDENIPPEQRRAVYEQRLYTELGRAANIVDTFAPGLPTGTRNALISLTYNAGSAWTSSGLGTKIRSGDLEGAKQNFAQYNQAGGTFNQGVADRRQTELSWWGGEPRDSDPTSQLGTALEKAKEQAIKVFPDDPGNQAKYLDTLQNRIKTDYSVLQAGARDMQLQTRNIVQRELFDPDHHVVDYDHLSPKAQQAYDQAPPMLQKSFDNAMRSNSTADVPLTAERQSRFDTLRGESINEPDKFMSRDVSNEDLPRPQKSILLKTQADRKALVDKGAKLNSALSTIQPLLNDAQIGKSATDQNKNAEYNKFSGVFQKALDDFYQEKKRPPTDKEMREIGIQLLKTTVTGPGYFGSLFGDRSDRAYRVVADQTPIQLRSDNPAAHYSEIPRHSIFIGPDGQKRIKP